MDHFPSRHGARVVFEPLGSSPAACGTRAPLARAASSRDAESERPKPRAPSYAEIDVVEANLAHDPRYDRE